MWTNNKLELIADLDQYTAEDGTLYPANYPKAEILELRPVETILPALGENEKYGTPFLRDFQCIYPVEPLTDAEIREKQKRFRDISISEIKVTTSTGKIFDGDETSQTRMARAILGLQAAGLTTIIWTLADNTQAVVTLPELTEAMILAGQEQARLWAI